MKVLEKALKKKKKGSVHQQAHSSSSAVQAAPQNDSSSPSHPVRGEFSNSTATIPHIDEESHDNGSEEDNDHEEECRELEILHLQSKCRSSLREIRLIDEELPMLIMRESSQYQNHAGEEGRRERGTEESRDKNNRSDRNDRSSSQGIEVTRIGYDVISGEMLASRETIRAEVFSPRMAPPSMTLVEFADLELADALDRQRREANPDKAIRPENDTRRMKHLEEEGLEDDYALLDAAVERDRVWDDWREANPRGSGNKMNKRF